MEQRHDASDGGVYVCATGLGREVVDMFPVKVDGTVLTLLVSGMLAGIAGIWRELRRGFTAESDVKSLEGDVAQLRDDVDRLTDRLDHAYLEINKLKGDKATLEAQNAVQRQEVKELRSQNRELRTQNEKLHAELTCVRERGGSG